MDGELVGRDKDIFDRDNFLTLLTFNSQQVIEVRRSDDFSALWAVCLQHVERLP
jgi:hypothetical protein